MEKILSNLADPEWWFTGLFFVAFLKALPILSGHTRKKARVFFRGRRLKQAAFVKSNRHNLAAVNFYSIKSQAYFVVYIFVCALYLVLFVAGPLLVQRESYLLFWLCLLPLMVAQVIWMNQEDKAKILVSEYNKMRVTKPSISAKPLRALSAPAGGVKQWQRL